MRNGKALILEHSKVLKKCYAKEKKESAMPSQIVSELIEKVGKLEGKVEMLISQQKWQFGLLATIVAGVLLNLLK